MAEQVDKAGSANVDVIALPELCRGQNDNSEEDLQGPTVTTMAALAKKHKTYIVLPIDRRNKNLRLNSVVLLDRSGNVACVYDKIFPYWTEYDVRPSTDVGEDAQVYRADFGCWHLRPVSTLASSKCGGGCQIPPVRPCKLTLSTTISILFP